MYYYRIKKFLQYKLPHKSENNIYLLLFGVLLIVFAIMLPFRDQLYSEDFAYAHSVRHLIDTGDLKISERLAPSSISLIVWGFIVTKILGFSLTNLHFAVIILLPFLLFGLYKLFHLIGCGKEKSLIFTLFFLSIPWILQLSYTFLTDIPFMILEVFALLFYLQAFKDGRLVNFLLGSIFTTVAFLARQLGMIFAIAAVITIILSENDLRQKIRNSLASLLIPVVAYFLYGLWLSLPGNRTIAQYSIDSEMKKNLSYFLPFSNISLNYRIENYIGYIHAFLKLASEALAIMFPIFALFLLTNWKKAQAIVYKNRLAFTIVILVTALVYIFDIIYFREGYNLGFPLIIYQYENLLPIPWAHLWKYFVLVGLPIFSYTIYLQRKNVFRFDNFQRFIFLSLVFLTIPTVIFVANWEVYIIPFLPLLLLWIAGSTKKLPLNLKLSSLVVLILILDSVQMTKLRYNESGLIWGKATDLVKSGVSPLEIDANNNFAWYYWFYYEQLASDAVRFSGGNKDRLNYGFTIPKPEFPKYKIYTSRMIHYSQSDTSNYNVQVLHLKSLFAESDIYFMQLK